MQEKGARHEIDILKAAEGLIGDLIGFSGSGTLTAAARQEYGEIETKTPHVGALLIFNITGSPTSETAAVMWTDNRFAHNYPGRGMTLTYMNRWWRDRLTGVFHAPVEKLQQYG